MQHFLIYIIYLYIYSTWFRLFLHPSSGAHNCTYSVRYTWSCMYEGRPVPQFLLTKENCKMVEKSVTVSAKLCALQYIFCVYRTLNTHKHIKYKYFLHEAVTSWVSEVRNWSESNSDDLQLSENKITPRGPKQEPPGRLSGDFRIQKLEKNIWWWGGKKEVSCSTVEMMLHIRSEVKLDTLESSVIFRFTNGLVLKNTIQWQTTRLSTWSF
jgi:hypothetical protein